MFEKLDELRAQTGLGSALYMQENDGKYALFLPLETIFSVAGKNESIEIDVTTSDTVTKLKGKKTLDDKDSDFFVHRDSLRKLESIKDKTVNLLKVNADYTAEKFAGTISYSTNDSKANEVNKGTITITPSSYDGYVDNCLDLLKPTAKFKSGIPAVVELTSKTGTFEFNIDLDPSDATFTAESESASIATATVTDNKLTITGVSEGSAVIKLVSAKADHASWETTILVIVPKA